MSKKPYQLSIGSLAIVIVLLSINDFANYETVRITWLRLGAPTALIFPLAITRIVGILVAIFDRWTRLREAAYIGLALEFLLAVVFHLRVGDGRFLLPVICGVLLALAFFSFRKIERDTIGPSTRNAPAR